MATWTISDELDARLRKRLGGTDVAEYIGRLISDQLDYEDDASYRDKIDEQIKASEADIAAGRVTGARGAMRIIFRK